MDLKYIKEREKLEEEVKQYYQEQDLPLRLEYLANQSINPFVPYCTSSRLQMVGSYLPTAVAIHGMTPRSVTTGMDRQFAKGVMRVKTPANQDVVVVKNLKRLPLADALNPENVVIYRELGRSVLGVLHLPKYQKSDEPFGFEYKPIDVNLSRGSVIGANTTVLEDYSITDDGNYQYGIELPTAMVDISQTDEDGLLISDNPELTKALTFTTYETININVDEDREFLVPLFDSKDGLKVIPDVGDIIPDNGVIACVRKNDALLAPTLRPVLNKPGARSHEELFFNDHVIYGRSGGKVIDVKITRGHQGSGLLVNRQLDRYVKDQARFYYSAIESVYQITSREPNVRLTGELNTLLTEAIAYLHNADPDGLRHLNRTYRMGLIDRRLKSGLRCSVRDKILSGYRISVTIAYDYRPCIGIKMTACHGDKGIVCGIWPHENMPTRNGRTAFIVTASASTLGRSNVSRNFDQFFGGIKDEMINNQRRLLGITRVESELYNRAYREDVVGAINALSDQQIIERVDSINDIMTEVNPEWTLAFLDMLNDQQAGVNDLRDWLTDILTDPVNKIQTYLRPDQAKPIYKSAEDVYEKFGWDIGPVTYTTPTGRTFTTRGDVPIAPMYFLLLDKLADNSHVVASAKRQPSGIPARLSAKDRDGYPVTRQVTRLFDETDTRLGCSNMPYGYMNEIADRANNPLAAAAVTDAIYNADNPGNIDNCVKRSETDKGRGKPIPSGQSRAQQLAIHPLNCAGIELTSE